MDSGLSCLFSCLFISLVDALALFFVSMRDGLSRVGSSA